MKSNSRDFITIFLMQLIDWSPNINNCKTTKKVLMNCNIV